MFESSVGPAICWFPLLSKWKFPADWLHANWSWHFFECQIQLNIFCSLNAADEHIPVKIN